MSKTYQHLFEFIAAAEKSRKYPSSTATSYKTPLRLIENELNEEEKESFETFKSHIDQIFQSFYSKNPSKMSAASYEEYKRRVKRLIDDYEKYGVDPTKMASWNRPVIIRKSNQQTHESKLSAANIDVPESNSGRPLEQGGAMNRFEFVFPPNRKVIILTPSDLNKEEARKIKAYIDYLENAASA